jgi:NADH-quinone oxidoreductase subunit H
MNWLNLLILIVQCLVIAIAVTSGFAYLTLFERRLLARFQNRIGPNRAGPNGFLQPAADAVKLFFKEDIIPAMADKAVYLLAPAMAVIPAIIIWAVIPLGCFNLNWDYSACFSLGNTGQLNNILQIADVNVGVLYLLAVTSVGVYGITLAGWASSNKYAMMGGIRSSAQLISYELALGLAVLAAVMQAGTMSTHAIVVGQGGLWAIFPQILGFIIFLIASTAEVVRAPFDLVEAEQELAGGYNTEYGSMKFALFFMAEYIKLIAVSAIAAMLYLGGWRFPGLEQLGAGLLPLTGPVFASIAVGLVSLGAFLLKVIFFLFLSVWIRASWPRVRYDRLMDLGWQWLLPLALVNVVLTAVVNVLVENRLLQAVIMFGVAVIALLIALNSSRSVQATSGITLVQPERSGD